MAFQFTDKAGFADKSYFATGTVIFHDATPVTPLVSPVLATTTQDLVVPPSAFVVEFQNSGTGIVTITLRDGSGAFGTGSYILAAGLTVKWPCAEMGVVNWPSIFRVVAAASTTCQYAFYCKTPTGS